MTSSAMETPASALNTALDAIASQAAAASEARRNQALQVYRERVTSFDDVSGWSAALEAAEAAGRTEAELIKDIKLVARLRTEAVTASRHPDLAQAATVLEAQYAQASEETERVYREMRQNCAALAERVAAAHQETATALTAAAFIDNTSRAADHRWLFASGTEWLPAEYRAARDSARRQEKLRVIEHELAVAEREHEAEERALESLQEWAEGDKRERVVHTSIERQIIEHFRNPERSPINMLLDSQLVIQNAVDNSIQTARPEVFAAIRLRKHMNRAARLAELRKQLVELSPQPASRAQGARSRAPRRPR